ncbi:hypothetical protein CVT24_000520 [Panaeolus cyanescens]|uniref:Cobalamin-independent methionine synthase MetE C-terminal/archaeal domain-containing protein n=1 Tax=Panaeolus cyanescens TaxID=181874 RepID=A0A409V8F2_9AGAR|nr:hypothetical protein CVT24_000520 [Panaeolus cyanescens]
MYRKPHCKADHVGSLLRPRELYDLRRQYDTAQCSPALKTAEDEAIKQAVVLQQELGLKTITDGEMRRACFFDGVFEKLEGMIYIPEQPIYMFKSYIPHIAMMYAMGIEHSPTFFCNGKIKRKQPFYVQEFQYLKRLVPCQDVSSLKVTMCSPTWFHQRHGSDLTYDTSVYKCDDEYFYDLGIAYREEIKELYEKGCRNIQIDDPTFCYFCSEAMLEGMEKAGVDHESLLDTYIRAINYCTRDRPADMTISLHMCRGNFKGAHFSEGGYERIAFKVFNMLDVDAFYLEYDTERAGDFMPLRHLPSNKTIVLGIMTTKSGKLESVEYLKGRVEEAVDVLCCTNPFRSREDALDQICISPQCGFASVWEGNPINQYEQRLKLGRLVEAAREIWPSEA